ncbi:hypothetical protein EDD22DRAFT_865506 [Suillus occidentalis]|nr:hypothetical protein EDD22DRAFT_865506 [Suillus occidentalis]
MILVLCAVCTPSVTFVILSQDSSFSFYFLQDMPWMILIISARACLHFLTSGKHTNAYPCYSVLISAIISL